MAQHIPRGSLGTLGVAGLCVRPYFDKHLSGHLGMSGLRVKYPFFVRFKNGNARGIRNIRGPNPENRHSHVVPPEGRDPGRL